MIKKIKISCSGATTARSDHSNPLITKFLPNKGNKWKGCEFFLNDSSITKADYWIIIGDVDLDEEVCEVSKNNVIFMTGEPQSIKRYDVSKEFINQFDRVFTSQHDLKHSHVFPCRPPINWWIDGGSPIKSKDEFDKWQGDGLSYDDFKNLKEIKKDKLISVFCSNKTFTLGHKMRFDFCKKLKEHFKDQLDWFGNGVAPIESKWDGIAPYKYHIALENFNEADYLTEKLLDPLMVLTYPIYSGATNVEKYFSKDQVTVIDIRYPKTAIAKIEELIATNSYEKNLPELFKARDLAMDKYNLFNLISEIVEMDCDESYTPVELVETKDKIHHKASLGFDKLNQRESRPQLIKIKKEQFFLLQTSAISAKSRRNIFQRIHRSLTKKAMIVKNNLTDFFLLLKFKLNKF